MYYSSFGLLARQILIDVHGPCNTLLVTRDAVMCSCYQMSSAVVEIPGINTHVCYCVIREGQRVRCCSPRKNTHIFMKSCRLTGCSECSSE